jgi:hypothetical protein
MLERVTRIAEQSTWRLSESRRSFLGRLGRGALAVTGVVAGWLAAPALAQAKTKACTTNANCGAGQYCAKPAGQCKGAGVCQPRPEFCPQIAYLFPGILGCDGAYYLNPCYAAQAGINVASYHPKVPAL